MLYKISLILLLVLSLSFSQNYSTRLIDQHTTSTLKRGIFDVVSRFSPPGGGTTGAGVVMGFEIGLSDRFMLGVSYGGDGIVGRGDIAWYRWPGALVKYRIFDETYKWPALAVGIDMQGSGGRESSYWGFTYKSEGLFVAISKTFLIFNRFRYSLHTDINYSFEDLSNAYWPNLMMGSGFSINEELTLLIEYDFAFNQLDIYENGESYGNPIHGFFSIGVEWDVFETLSLEVNLRDITNQKLASTATPFDNAQGWGREVGLTYHGSF
jgi:hypothetical protein